LGRAAREATLPIFRINEAMREGVEDAAQAHARLGVDLVLESAFRLGDNHLSVRQSIVEAKTQHLLRAKNHTFSTSAGPLLILETLSAGARKMLELPRDVGGTRKTRFGTEGDGSMQLYLEGLGRSISAKTAEDLDAAEHAFELASNIDPAFAQAQAERGWILYEHFTRDKDRTWLEKAAALARTAMSVNPQLATGHKLLGYASYRLGDPATAKQSLERAVALDPCDFPCFREWARVYGRQGDADSEEVVYRRAIAQNGYDWRPYYWLATQLYARGRFNESRQSVEDVVRLAPDNYLGYSYRGAVSALEGRYKEAIVDLERSIALNPTADALSNLGTAYFNLRRMSDAILTYNRSFQFGFENHLLWINLGDAYRCSPGREDQAKKAYREAIEHGLKEFEERPYHFEIQAELAPILARVGAADSARAWMASSLEKGTDNPNIEYCAALTFWELGQQKEGLDHLEKAVREGYPRTWLRDSALFDAWRGSPRFQVLATVPAPSAKSTTSPSEGGS
jgi:tetratricopeptide (TPR) repeat protein